MEVIMAIRNIVIEGDPLLNKKSRKVEKFDDRLFELLDDMKETMYHAEGVGISAPQVGILRQIFLVDIGLGLTEFINPEILSQEGQELGSEGCLSIPGVYGTVNRPTKVVLKACDRNGKEFTLEANDFMARAICHEYDHLQGILFRSKVVEFEE